jgi:predicted DNA-binding transcriptional regulator AlpA
VPDPLLVSAADAAKMIGLSRAMFYSLHSSGALGPLPLAFGRRRLWKRSELERWVDANCPPREEWMKECQR